MSAFEIIVAMIPFYLVGTFPSGYILAKKRGVDITKTGSGNVGATNITRTLGKKAGAITLLADCFKGFIATYVAWKITDDIRFSAWAGCAAVLGHCFSIPGKLKGGKGIATALGVYLSLDHVAALLALFVFICAVKLFRTVSVGSVAAAVMIPCIAIFRGIASATIPPMLVISMVVIYRHRENILNLINGTERKLPAKPNGA